MWSLQPLYSGKTVQSGQGANENHPWACGSILHPVLHRLSHTGFILPLLQKSPREYIYKILKNNKKGIKRFFSKTSFLSLFSPNLPPGAICVASDTSKRLSTEHAVLGAKPLMRASPDSCSEKNGCCKTMPRGKLAPNPLVSISLALLV